ncbi:MAG: protein kinase [Planctomycetaceae bacterium]|nr:protein kinase [Planctomycetaceae bacterium]
MNASALCLDDNEIQILLNGEMQAPRMTTLEQHLSECSACRERLEHHVGDETWWYETESCLRSTPTDATFEGRPEISTQQLLELLGPTDDPDMLGRIGRYEIVGVLGQGGMGAVFKGLDRSLNRYVAIKLLLPHLAASGTARKRFAREAQAVAAVVDDHVMAIHCVDQWQGIPYLVMTWSPGVTLQKRLAQDGPLDVREILRIGMQAAKGLAAAHAQGIIHRDIKPANIFLDQNVERVQLMDFGLARAADDASLTRSGTLTGTPQYMSPEQVRAEAMDHRSDLFSLGSVLYAMCTGHPPFRAESSYSVMRLITDKQPRPVQETNPDIPDWLCRIIDRLMSKDPAERFQSAEEVAELLEACLAHLQHPATTPLPLAVRTEPQSARRVPIGKVIAAAVAGLVTLFAGVLIVLDLNKGTLQIESELDGVPIRILEGDTVVESLTVSQDGTSTRIRAGKYIVEIDQAFDQASIKDGVVTISRGDTTLIKVTRHDPEVNRDAKDKDTAAMEWLRRPVDGRTLDGMSFQMTGEDALLHCVMTNNADALNRLLTMDRYDLDAMAQRGQWTLLQHALHHGNADTTALLLKHGADPQNVADGTPTPLELAERSGDPRLIAIMQRYLTPHTIVDEADEYQLTDNLSLRTHPVETEDFGTVHRATFLWAATETRPELRFEVDIASSRHCEKWVVCWEDHSPVVWLVVKGHFQSSSSIRCIDLHTPANVITYTAYGDDDFDLKLPELSLEQQARRLSYSIGAAGPQIPNHLSARLVRFGITSILPTGPYRAGGQYSEPAVTVQDWTVGGRVTDAAGNPVADATITLWDGGLGTTATSDSEGMYELRFRSDLFSLALNRSAEIIARKETETGETLTGSVSFDLLLRSDEDFSVLTNEIRNELTTLKSPLPRGRTFPEDAAPQRSGNSGAILRERVSIDVTLHAPPPPVETKPKSLSEAVREFNNLYSRDRHGRVQPPVTESEVIACLKWNLGNDSFSDDIVRQLIPFLYERDHILPDGWNLTGGLNRSVHPQGVGVIETWEVNLELNGPSRFIPIRRTAQEALTAPTPAPEAEDEKEIPLDDAVKAFNQVHPDVERQRRFPEELHPLTSEEVFAAIALWDPEREASPVSSSVIARIRRIAEIQRLPTDIRFEVIPTCQSSIGESFLTASVQMLVPDTENPDSIFAFPIRQQFIEMDLYNVEKTHWGEPAENGIQAGFRLIPSQLIYERDQVIEVEFLYRNVYGSRIPIMLPDSVTYNEIQMSTEVVAVRTIDVQHRAEMQATTYTIGRELVVLKGQKLQFCTEADTAAKEDVGTLLIAEPGKGYTLKFRIPNLASGAANESLWTGRSHYFRTPSLKPEVILPQYSGHWYSHWGMGIPGHRPPDESTPDPEYIDPFQIGVSLALAEKSRIPAYFASGFAVTKVAPHSPAMNAGIEVGDILLSWEDNQLHGDDPERPLGNYSTPNRRLSESLELYAKSRGWSSSSTRFDLLDHKTGEVIRIHPWFGTLAGGGPAKSKLLKQLLERKQSRSEQEP